MSSVFLFKTGECKSEEFIEYDSFYIGRDGTIHYANFIEGDYSVRFKSDAIYATEFIEKTIVYLMNESDSLLTDESGNCLISVV